MSEPQRPTRSRWRQRLHNWVTRGQVPGTEHTLGHRNIYVLPSAAGCMLAQGHLFAPAQAPEDIERVLGDGPVLLADLR